MKTIRYGFEHDYFECRCSSNEHTVRFSLDVEDGTIYVATHLQEDRFFRRLWNGVKYIFGHRSVYGHFEETLLHEDDYDKMIDMLQRGKKLDLKYKAQIVKEMA